MDTQGPFSFRALRHEDLPVLAQWMVQPHVSRWWLGPTDVEGLAAKYGRFIDGLDQRTSYMIIEHEAVPVGFIQHYRVDDYPEWSDAIQRREAAGIDYLIGDAARCGKGFGSAAIVQFVGVVLDAYPDVASVVAAPQQSNTPSWKALEKAGFARVWEGMLTSDDPSDSGPAYVYERRRLSDVRQA